MNKVPSNDGKSCKITIFHGARQRFVGHCILGKTCFLNMNIALLIGALQTSRDQQDFEFTNFLILLTFNRQDHSHVFAGMKFIFLITSD